jgi:hypothetical protein
MRPKLGEESAMGATLPRRRGRGLLVESLADETIVYDTTRHKAHCLSRLATLIWSRCDGQTTMAAMVEVLRGELGVPADETLVRSALGQLERLHLLEPAPAGATRAEAPLSRRDLARVLARYGIAATLVATIVSPTTAAAASCVKAGKACMRKGVVIGTCCPKLSCSRVRGNRVLCQ